MMAARWTDLPQEREGGPAPSCKAKRQDACDHSEASAAASPSGDEETFCWPGPKTLHLRRTSQGFGFTLRHFIVYPPESAVHNSLKDEDNGIRGRQRNRLEPMDTIFVKQVKEGGPAHGAGLCTGDRIVKVNGESIIGKTYSQVIALIQNSEASLELCVMPKDEDILQLFSRDITALAYSQDAYLKGNEAYNGNAQNIPEPPPICYPKIEVKAACSTPALGVADTVRGTASGVVQKNHRVEIPVPPAPPSPPPTACVCSENVRTVAPPPDPEDRGLRVARAAPSHRTEENRYGPVADSGCSRPKPFIPSVPGGAQLQYPFYQPREAPVPSSPRPRSVYSETLLPSTRTASPESFSPANSPKTNQCSPSQTVPSSSSPHQNIDWKNYTTYKDYIDSKRLHTYGSRTIQERLDSLRAASSSGSAYTQQRTLPPACAEQRAALASQVRWRSASHDRGGTDIKGTNVTAPSRSFSQERLGSEKMAAPRKWPRSVSQDAFPLSASPGVTKPRARSCDHLGQQGAVPRGLVSAERSGLDDRVRGSRGDEATSGRHRVDVRVWGHEGREEEAPPGALVFTKGRTDPAPSLQADGLIIRPSRLPVKNPLLEPPLTPPSSKSPGPLKDQRVNTTGNHLGSLSPLHLLRSRADSLKMESRAEAGLTARSSSCSGPSARLSLQRPLQRPLQSTVSTISTSSNGAVTPRAKVAGASSSTGSLCRTNGGIEGPDATVVVLRRDKISASALIRPPSYVHPGYDKHHGVMDRSLPLIKAGSEDGALGWRSKDMQCRRPGESSRRSDCRNLDDSLDSIPFIDDPSSPSVDLDSTHILASAVISTTPIISTIPPSPTSPSALMRRQMSHDQDSMRLTIIDSDSGSKTERSKSCDEGLDNYRQESRGRSFIPGLKTLRKAVDRSSGESSSRRDSSSDLFCDVTKEGLLHFKQLQTEKGKRVGGGVRPWKQMFGVLRGHYLCLYKERKDVASGDEPLHISIRACLIDISYSDTKRKNVLRLTTSDCEFLFQAEDRDDMLAWIRAIQENSNLDEENAAFTSHDLISRKIKEYNTLMSPTGSRSESSPRTSRQSLSIRQTLLGGKGENRATSPHSPRTEQNQKNVHKDEISPPKDKASWRRGIDLMKKPFEKKPSVGVTFGVRLEDCPPAHSNKWVPLIVEVCCRLVEDRGLDYTGIYRVPGNNAAISSMQEELNHKGVSDAHIQDDKWRDLNVISSLLKSFFRKLPEPLFTNDRYADFIEANRIEAPVERLKGLKRLLHELPDHHYETLKFLSAHLKTVAENSEKNKMEPRNLAIVFGPTLVRTTEDNMTHMVTHMPDQYKIVETLIQKYDWFFTEDGDQDPVTVSQEGSSAVESQPVPNIDHLLTNIGRTAAPHAEVSDSPTSDSAKSKGSWGSGKEPCSRDLLVSSIFAAASRKRRKSKEKTQASSSDDDLEAVFTKKEISAHKANPRDPQLRPKDNVKLERTQNIRADAESSETRRERRNPSPTQEAILPRPTPSSPLITDSPRRSFSVALQGKSSSSSDPPSQLDENTSDVGTMSSGASVPRSRPRKWTGGVAPDLSAYGGPGGGLGASAGAEVSSITSDYSTTSSITFLTGAESGALSPELVGGEEADDERSELISEGRPMETDSESDFSVFAPEAASSPSAPCAGAHRPAEGSTPRLDSQRLFPAQAAMESDPPLSRRWSLRQKTDSESSVDGGGQVGPRADSSTRFARVLEVMKKGRSTSSLSSSSRSESERSEPAWHLRLTERLKLRLRPSADDLLTPRSRTAADSRGRKKNIRRRHTMGGQRDLADLAVISDWRERGGAPGGGAGWPPGGGAGWPAELSALQRLKPRCASQDFSIRDWIDRERHRAPEPSMEGAPRAVPEDDPPEGVAPPPAAQAQPHVEERVKGGEQQSKNRSPPGADPHPHKLSGTHMVRSRFYQYL